MFHTIKVIANITFYTSFGHLFFPFKFRYIFPYHIPALFPSFKNVNQFDHKIEPHYLGVTRPNMSKMNAVRFYGQLDIRVEQIEIPNCGKGQVKVCISTVSHVNKMSVSKGTLIQSRSNQRSVASVAPMSMSTSAEQISFQ